MAIAIPWLRSALPELIAALDLPQLMAPNCDRIVAERLSAPQSRSWQRSDRRHRRYRMSLDRDAVGKAAADLAAFRDGDCGCQRCESIVGAALIMALLAAADPGMRAGVSLRLGVDRGRGDRDRSRAIHPRLPESFRGASARARCRCYRRRRWRRLSSGNGGDDRHAPCSVKSWCDCQVSIWALRHIVRIRRDMGVTINAARSIRSGRPAAPAA